MIRNLKVFALALVAMMGLTAMSAAAASAADFHADANPIFIEGTTVNGSNHVFHAAGSTITCTEGKFTGTVEGTLNGGSWTTQDITAAAAYNNCTVTVFGFKIAATVNMGGCAYTFNANGEVGVVNRKGASKTCAEENITYRVSNFAGECDVKVGPQTGLLAATYDGPSTANGDITVTPAVQKIHGVAKGTLCTEGTFTDGQYTSGSTTVKGYKDVGGVKGEQTPIWWG